MKFRLGELFCGPGGIGLGASEASFLDEGTNEVHQIEHAWANDYDEWTCKTYARNILEDKEFKQLVTVDDFNSGKTGSVIWGDVRKLEINRLPDIDALAFGFPCNDYSLVGEKKGLNGDFGPLYTYGKKVLDVKKPKWFLAENVSGLQSSNEGRAFREILSDLASAGDSGYDLTVHLYPFEKYRVPQTRSRIIIVGIDKREGKKFRVPAPTTETPITCAEALKDIDPKFSNQEVTRQSSKVVERLKRIPEGQNAWYKDLPVEYQLNVKGARMSQIYRRLDSSKPAYTITGSGGGGTHVYHWSEPRALTNRERARLQTFPDEFVFEGPKENVRKQIGMAVPPVGAEVIFGAILKTMAGIPYPSIEAKFSYLTDFNEKANHAVTN